MTLANDSLPLIFDPEILSVGKLKQSIDLPQNSKHILSLTTTSEEISLVAPSSFFDSIKHIVTDLETNWQSIKVDQVLDFSMIGVLARISQILASAEISIYVISTFNTDYILIKKESMALALKTLTEHHFPVSTLA